MKFKILIILLVSNLSVFAQLSKIKDELSKNLFFYDNIQLEALGVDSIKRIEIIKYTIRADTISDSSIIKVYICYVKKLALESDYYKLDSLESMQYSEIYHYPFIEYKYKVNFSQFSYKEEKTSQYFAPTVVYPQGNISCINYLIDNDSITTLNIRVTSVSKKYSHQIIFKYIYDNQNKITRCENYINEELKFIYKYYYYY